MELLVLIMVLPIIIPLLIIYLIIVLIADKHSTKNKKRYVYYGEEEFENMYGEELYDYHRTYQEKQTPSSHRSWGEEILYGGIPIGDSMVYLTDDDDICDEFRDKFC